MAVPHPRRTVPRHAPQLALPARPFRPGAGMARPALPGDERPAPLRFRYALDLFNHGFWWEAHEVWEGLWRAHARGTPERTALQGLIMLAGALLKAWTGPPAGRARLCARALQRLDAAAGSTAALYGLPLRDAAQAARAWCAAPPPAAADHAAVHAGQPVLRLADAAAGDAPDTAGP